MISSRVTSDTSENMSLISTSSYNYEQVLLFYNVRKAELRVSMRDKNLGAFLHIAAT
jgi:hypothetical protein